MEIKQSKVAVVRCDSYEPDKVQDAIREAVLLLGGFDHIFEGETAIEAFGKNAEILRRKAV